MTPPRAQVNAYARKIKADGDERPIGQIRIAVILALIMRPWEERDPAVAHVTVNADLADLLLPDLEDLVPDAPTGDRPDEDDTTDDEGTADVDAEDGEGPAAEPEAAETGGDDLAARSTQPDAQGTAPLRVEGTALPRHQGTVLPSGGAQVGDVDGQPVSPAAVKELLRRIDALGLTHPDGGHLTFTITGTDQQLLAVATPEELEAAARTNQGVGPPAVTPAYRPTAAQYRYLRARDRHCRFPGCRQTALTTEADHVIPYDHADPARGGRTCVTNLALLCKRHHLLKTHAPGWTFALDPDGTLHVTTPGGTTRTTRPPAADEVLDLLDPPPPPHDPAADPPPF